MAVKTKTDDGNVVERARRCGAAARHVRPAPTHTSVSPDPAKVGASTCNCDDTLGSVRSQKSIKVHKLQQLYRREPQPKRELWIQDSSEGTSSAFTSSNADERDRVLSEVISTQLTVDEDGIMRMRKEPLPNVRDSKKITEVVAGSTEAPSVGTSVNMRLEADASIDNSKETTNNESNVSSGGTGDSRVKKIIPEPPLQPPSQSQKASYQLNPFELNVSAETSNDPAGVILIAMPSSEQRRLHYDNNHFETDLADYADDAMQDNPNQLCIGKSLRAQFEDQLKLKGHSDQNQECCGCIHKRDLEGCRCAGNNECKEARIYSRQANDDTPEQPSNQNHHCDLSIKYQKLIIDGKTSSHAGIEYLKQHYFRSNAQNETNRTSTPTISEEYDSDLESNEHHKVINEPKDHRNSASANTTSCRRQDNERNPHHHKQNTCDHLNNGIERGNNCVTNKMTKCVDASRKKAKRVDFQFKGKLNTNLISEDTGNKRISNDFSKKNDVGQTVDRHAFNIAYEDSNSNISNAKALLKSHKSHADGSQHVSSLADRLKSKLFFNRRNKCDGESENVTLSRGILTRKNTGSNSSRCPVHDLSNNVESVEEPREIRKYDDILPRLIRLPAAVNCRSMPNIGLQEKSCACEYRVPCNKSNDQPKKERGKMSMPNVVCQCADSNDDSRRGKGNFKNACDCVTRNWKLTLPTNCPYSENFENLKEDAVYAILDDNGVPYKVIVNISHNTEVKPETYTVGIQYEDLPLPDTKVASSAIGVKRVEPQNVKADTETQNKVQYQRAIFKSATKMESTTQDVIKLDHLVVVSQDLSKTEPKAITNYDISLKIPKELTETQRAQYECDVSTKQEHFNKHHTIPEGADAPVAETSHRENIEVMPEITFKTHKVQQIQDGECWINKQLGIRADSNTQEIKNHMEVAYGTRYRMNSVKKYSDSFDKVVISDIKTIDRARSIVIESGINCPVIHDTYKKTPASTDIIHHDKDRIKQVHLNKMGHTNLQTLDEHQINKEDIQSLFQNVKNINIQPKFKKGLERSKKIEIEKNTSNLATILDYSTHGIDLSESESDTSDVVRVNVVGSNRTVARKKSLIKSTLITKDGVLYEQHTEESVENSEKKYKPLIRVIKDSKRRRDEETDSDAEDRLYKEDKRKIEMVVRKYSNQNRQVRYDRAMSVNKSSAKVIKNIARNTAPVPGSFNKIESLAKNSVIISEVQNESLNSKTQYGGSFSKSSIKRSSTIKESETLNNVKYKRSVSKILSRSEFFVVGSGGSERSKLAVKMETIGNDSEHKRSDSKSVSKTRSSAIGVQYEDMSVIKPPSDRTVSKSGSNAVGRQYEKGSSFILKASLNPIPVQYEENEDFDLSTEASIIESGSISDEKEQSNQDLSELKPVIVRPRRRYRQNGKGKFEVPTPPRKRRKFHLSSVEPTPQMNISNAEGARHESSVRFNIEDDYRDPYCDLKKNKCYNRYRDAAIPISSSYKVVQPTEPYVKLYSKYRGPCKHKVKRWEESPPAPIECEHKPKRRDEIYSDSNECIELKAKRQGEKNSNHEYLIYDPKPKRKIIVSGFRGPKMETCGTIFKAIQSRHTGCVCQKVYTNKRDGFHCKEKPTRCSSHGQQCAHRSDTWHVTNRDTFANGHNSGQPLSTSQLKKEVSRIKDLSFMKPGFFAAKFKRGSKIAKATERSLSLDRYTEFEALGETELTLMDLQQTLRSPTDNCSSETSSYASLSFEDSVGKVTFLKYFRRELRRRRVMALNTRSFTVLARRKRRARRKAKRSKIKSTTVKSNGNTATFLFKRLTSKKQIKPNSQPSNDKVKRRFTLFRKSENLKKDKGKIKHRERISEDLLRENAHESTAGHTRGSRISVQTSVVIKSRKLPTANLSFTQSTAPKPGRAILKTFRRLRLRKHCGIGRVANAICTSIVSNEINQPPTTIVDQPKNVSDFVTSDNIDLPLPIPTDKLAKVVSFEFNIKDGVESGKSNQPNGSEENAMRTEDVKELLVTRSSDSKKNIRHIPPKDFCIANSFQPNENFVIKTRDGQKVKGILSKISPSSKLQVPQQRNTFGTAAGFNDRSTQDSGNNLNASRLRKCVHLEANKSTPNRIDLELQICEKNAKHSTYETPTKIIKPQCEYLYQRSQNDTHTNKAQDSRVTPRCMKDTPNTCACPIEQKRNEVPVTNIVMAWNPPDAVEYTNIECDCNIDQRRTEKSICDQEVENLQCPAPSCYERKQFSEGDKTQIPINKFVSHEPQQCPECPDPPRDPVANTQYPELIPTLCNQEVEQPECSNPTCALDAGNLYSQEKKSQKASNRDDYSKKNKGKKSQSKISQDSKKKKQKNQGKKSQNKEEQSKNKKCDSEANKSEMQTSIDEPKCWCKNKKGVATAEYKFTTNDCLQTVCPAEITTPQEYTPTTENNSCKCACSLDADLLEAIRCKCRDGKKAKKDDEIIRKKFYESIKTCPDPARVKQTADKCSSPILLDGLEEVRVDCGTQDTGNYCKGDLGQNYNCIKIYVDDELKENLNCNDLELVAKPRETKIDACDDATCAHGDKLRLCACAPQQTFDQGSPPNVCSTHDQPPSSQSPSPRNDYSFADKPPEENISDDSQEDYFPKASGDDIICTQISNKVSPGQRNKGVKYNRKNDYNLEPCPSNKESNKRVYTPKQHICDDSSDDGVVGSGNIMCARKSNKGDGLKKLLEPRQSASDVLATYHKRKYEDDTPKRTISFKNKIETCTQKRKEGVAFNPRNVPPYLGPSCDGSPCKVPPCAGPTQGYEYYEERNGVWDPISTIFCNVAPTSSVMSMGMDDKLSSQYKETLVLDKVEMETAKSIHHQARKKEVIQIKPEKKSRKKNERQPMVSERNFGADIWNGPKRLLERCIMSKYVPEKYRPAGVISKYRCRYDDITSKYSNDVCVSATPNKGKNYKKVLENETIDVEGIKLSVGALSRHGWGGGGNTEEEERMVRVHGLSEAPDSDGRGPVAVWITSSHSKRSTYPPSRFRRNANGNNSLAESGAAGVRGTGQRRPKRRCDRRRAKRNTTDTEKELDSADSSYILFKNELFPKGQGGKHRKKSRLPHRPLDPSAPSCASSWPRSSGCPCRGQGACAASHSTAEERSTGRSSTLYIYTSRSSRSKQASLSPRVMSGLSWHRSPDSTRPSSRSRSRSRGGSQTACYMEKPSRSSWSKSMGPSRDGSTNVHSARRNTASSKKSLQSDSRGEHMSRSSGTSRLKKGKSRNHGVHDGHSPGELAPRWRPSPEESFTDSKGGRLSAILLGSQISGPRPTRADDPRGRSRVASRQGGLTVLCVCDGASAPCALKSAAPCEPPAPKGGVPKRKTYKKQQKKTAK